MSKETLEPCPSTTQDASNTATLGCNFSILATPGVVLCPICFHAVPPEHIGYKLHCRNCGYLESCCNPL